MNVNEGKGKAINSLENQFVVFLKMAILHRFYCTNITLTGICYNYHIYTDKHTFFLIISQAFDSLYKP